MATASRLILACLLLVALACDSAPQEPEFDNPIIPDDPNYEPPQTTIVAGPTEGAIIDSHAVTFTWQGNQDSMAFTYKLNENSWSDWATDTAATFQYLDEGDYLFEVQGQYASGVIEDTAASRSFTIDDIHGPALWLMPRYQEVVSSGTFSVEVMLEDVTDVMAVKAVLEFDPAALQVSNVEVYDDSRSLLKANGGTVIPFSSYDNATGIATIEVATATGNPAGVSGTGAIARVTLMAAETGEAQVSFTAACTIREPDNVDITLSDLVQALVEVQ